MHKYETKTEGNNVEIFDGGADIGGYEISSDGCRAFGVNHAGDDYFIGHTLTERSARRLIERAASNIERLCR